MIKIGLDVSFYDKATLVHEDEHPRALSGPKPEPSEECYDTFTVVYVGPFPDQADGIKNRSCWETGERKHIHHSYGGYNQYRAWLCMAFFGVEPEVVWNDLEKYAGRPFFEQIHFADNEGTIGPKTAAKLAKDYAEQRDYVEQRMKGIPKPFDSSEDDHLRNIDYMLAKYDEWAAGFALAADTGMVDFH